MSFSSIPPLTSKPPPTDPFEIFARRPSLPDTPNDLWSGQYDALQAWVKARTKRDVLINLNTGSGKTMLGVLIGQAMANERGGKCVYVCSTIDLVLQTEREAKKLGISPSTYYGSKFSTSDFEQGKTFCITTYQSVFNSNTTFRKQDVNRFIFDDAHVAEKAIRDAFTLSITRENYPELYIGVAQLLSPAFEAAGQQFRLKEILERKDNGIVLVPPMLALVVRI
jgi:replicative superfamily II helicase